MGHTAEFIAQHHDISREAMDEVALRSHNNTERATRKVISRMKSWPWKCPPQKRPPRFRSRRTFQAGHDHGRPPQTAAGLRSQNRQGHGRKFQRPQRRIGAMMIMSADKARELGLTPLARIKAVGHGRLPPVGHGIVTGTGRQGSCWNAPE
jgi:acetyl-CoA C-acetyltransferase